MYILSQHEPLDSHCVSRLCRGRPKFMGHTNTNFYSLTISTLFTTLSCLVSSTKISPMYGSFYNISTLMGF